MPCAFSGASARTAGNTDACFYLDESSGVLTAKCEVARMPTKKRVLNVTATDGQHFADVMPIDINLVETEGFRRDTSMNGRNAVFQLHHGVFAEKRGRGPVVADPAFLALVGLETHSESLGLEERAQCPETSWLKCTTF